MTKSSGGFPIIFIHSGTAPFVPYALLQARLSNPEADIILLGDVGNQHLQGLTRHVHMRQYWRGATALDQVFVNMSTNSPGFELICLQRWFCLLEFMQAEKLADCLYLDTDVLLYANAQAEHKDLAPATMTVSGISGHTNFIRGLDGLKAYTELIMDSYASAEGRNWLAEQYRLFCIDHSAGGISDMSFFTWFRERNADQVADISIPRKSRVFDITMDYTAHFEERDGIKKIDMVNGQPFGYLRTTGEQIGFNTLHFQGAAKQHIARFCMAGGGKSTYWLLKNQCYYALQKVRKKLLKN